MEVLFCTKNSTNSYDIFYRSPFFESNLLDNDYCLCPFCKKLLECEMTIQYESHVTYPMLWCSNCNAKSVLLIDTCKKLTTKAAVAKATPTA